jgi:DNA-binding winged helix-turn-helix (wHTH) protein/predicted ATPase
LPAVRIEAENEWAWCGERRLRLTPRAFAVLRRLVEHAGRLVTKEEFFASVWRDTIVSETALASCIRDLRRALDDSSRTPRYIETAHRRGFRFIGPIARPSAAPVVPEARCGGAGPGTEPPSTPDSAFSPAPVLVGRATELARLHERLARATDGQRQLVFVTGEPGIGKTALVETFLAQMAGREGLRVARGQCVEQYGAGEAYLPVLEALGRLGRAVGGDALVQVLKRHAPTWLAQLPALLTDRELETVQRRAEGATRERMLRELVDALDVLGSTAPLVLLLEDLHWSDSATIDLLAMLARRQEAARLLVVGTYRPADVIASGHPLRAAKQELQLHGRCEELIVSFLDVAAVDEYLARRFPASGFPSDLARVLQQHTDGNPLFLVNTVDDLIARAQLREVDGRWTLAAPASDIALGTPQTLWQMVEKQVERLTPEERAMLAVASVAGMEFSAAVASAAGIEAPEGERRCERLARRGQILRAAGVAEWPDGTVAGRYAFIHALYQSVLYARVSIGQRVGLHLRTGERLERGYGESAGEIAGELAMHFERGRDLERALQYRRLAGENALRQHGYREAATHATRALDLLGTLPHADQRAHQELALQVMLAAALTATRGYAAAEVERAYARARALCSSVGDTPELPAVLLGLARFYTVRGALPTARDVGRQLLASAEATQDQALLLVAHNILGQASFYMGELADALPHLERAIALYDPDAHSPGRARAFRAGQDIGLTGMTHAALTLWTLGYPARATARMDEALARARSLRHPLSLTYACHFAAQLRQCCGDRHAMAELEDTALALATEHGFELFRVAGDVHRGWLLAERGQAEEGLARMRRAVDALREIGADVRIPAFLALMAAVCEKIRRPADGLSVVREALALAEASHQHYWTAELYRLEGALTVQVDGGQAEACFRTSLEIARRQGARSFELRAATSLSRLWASQGKPREAHALLSDVYACFTDGVETADLREARALLDELAVSLTRGRAPASPAGRRRPPRRT